MGWCETVDMAPTKKDGYIQITPVAGYNKMCTLHEAVLYAQSGAWEVSADTQISHRCNNPKCRTLGHVCLESASANNSRKGCLIAVKCPCGSGAFFMCPHRPCCIPQYKPGGSTHATFGLFIRNLTICHHIDLVNGKPEMKVGPLNNLPSLDPPLMG